MSELARVREEEFPVFRGESYEEHVSTWLDIDRSVQGHYWMLGAVAASLVKKYGEDVAGKFASDVNSSRTRIWEYAATYKAWENYDRSEFLSFKHHTLAARSQHPQKALEVAEEEELSTRELEEFVKTGEIPTKGSGYRPPKTFEAVRDELQQQGLRLQVVEDRPDRSEAEELPLEVDERAAAELTREPAKARGKMDIHFSSKTDQWYTPPEFVGRVARALGEIDLDPCADDGKDVPAATHFTKADDGLVREWFGRVFMNPPYGNNGGGIEPFVRKLVEEFEAGRVVEAVALVPAKTDTRWFALLDPYPRCFVRGRLKFSGHENSAPFPSAAVYMGPDKAGFLAAFADLGTVFERTVV